MKITLENKHTLEILEYDTKTCGLGHTLAALHEVLSDLQARGYKVTVEVGSTGDWYYIAKLN